MYRLVRGVDFLDLAAVTDAQRVTFMGQALMGRKVWAASIRDNTNKHGRLNIFYFNEINPISSNFVCLLAKVKKEYYMATSA